MKSYNLYYVYHGSTWVPSTPINPFTTQVKIRVKAYHYIVPVAVSISKCIKQYEWYIPFDLAVSLISKNYSRNIYLERSYGTCYSFSFTVTLYSQVNIYQVYLLLQRLLCHLQ